MFLRDAGNLFHSPGAATWNARSPKAFLVIFLGIFNRQSFEDLRLYALVLTAIRLVR